MILSFSNFSKSKYLATPTNLEDRFSLNSFFRLKKGIFFLFEKLIYFVRVVFWKIFLEVGECSSKHYGWAVSFCYPFSFRGDFGSGFFGVSVLFVEAFFYFKSFWFVFGRLCFLGLFCFWFIIWIWNFNLGFLNSNLNNNPLGSSRSCGLGWFDSFWFRFCWGGGHLVKIWRSNLIKSVWNPGESIKVDGVNVKVM